jgi:hypothetical protein
MLFEKPKSYFVKRKRRKYDTINSSTRIETRDRGVRVTYVTPDSVISLSHRALVTGVARFELLRPSR